MIAHLRGTLLEKHPNLVIVDTEDALLIAHRDHSQDVGKVVKELSQSGKDDLI